MHFRPYPVLTIAALPILAALIWLGTWQLGRADWKRGLIAGFETAAAAKPLSLSDALCIGDNVVGRIIAAEGVLGGPPSVGNDLRMYGQDALGTAGWMHLTAMPPPVCIAEEGPLLVEAGFEPFPDPSVGPGVAAAEALPARYVVTAWPKKPPFAAANAPDENDWHWFDGPAMAERLGTGKLNTRIYLATFSGRMPDRLTRTPPATHIGYAVTWFGMAVGLVLIYAAFHMRAGRLRFSREKSKS